MVGSQAGLVKLVNVVDSLSVVLLSINFVLDSVEFTALVNADVILGVTVVKLLVPFAS